MKDDENLKSNEDPDELKLFIEKKKSQNEALKKMVEQLQNATSSNDKNNKQK